MSLLSVYKEKREERTTNIVALSNLFAILYY